MDLHEHILPADMVRASEEFKCIKDCLRLIVSSIEKGDIQKAQERSHDMLRSLQDLRILAERKTELDKRKHLLTGMPTVTHMEITRAIESE